MKKSEIVENYFKLSKQMMVMLDDLSVNVKRESKAIPDITLNVIDRMNVKYKDEDKHFIYISLSIDEPTIKGYIQENSENGKKDENSEVELLLAEIDLELGILNKYDLSSYKKLLNVIVDEIEKTIKDLTDQKEYLIEKKKSFINRIIYPHMEVAISNINNALSVTNKIFSGILVENKLINGINIDSIINTFLEESKVIYGLNDVKVIKIIKAGDDNG